MDPSGCLQTFQQNIKRLDPHEGRGGDSVAILKSTVLCTELGKVPVEVDSLLQDNGVCIVHDRALELLCRKVKAEV